MSNNPTLLDNATMIEKYYINLKDQRAYYIMHRVVLLQFFFLFITGMITSLILMVESQHIVIDLWYLYLIISPTIIICGSVLKCKKLGPSKTWKEAIVPIMLLWCVLTVSLGVIFDVIFGFGTTFWVSFFMAMYYGIGYLLAITIRRNRFRYPKKYWQISMPIICTIISVVPLILGLNSLFEIVKKYNIKSFFLHDYGEFLSCFPCALSIFYMISGTGITLSMLLNYGAITQLCYDTTKSNVIYKSPPKLIFVYLMTTSIIMFIFWVFIEILIPPLIGGRGNGSSSGGLRGGIVGSGSSKIILENSIKNEINKTNQMWHDLVIPTTYIPFIVNLIEFKLKEKLESPAKGFKKSILKMDEYSSGYKTDYSPKGKHYSTNYSPYSFKNKNYSINRGIK